MQKSGVNTLIILNLLCFSPFFKTSMTFAFLHSLGTYFSSNNFWTTFKLACQAFLQAHWVNMERLHHVPYMDQDLLASNLSSLTSSVLFMTYSPFHLISVWVIVSSTMDTPLNLILSSSYISFSVSAAHPLASFSLNICFLMDNLLLINLWNIFHLSLAMSNSIYSKLLSLLFKCCQAPVPPISFPVSIPIFSSFLAFFYGTMNLFSYSLYSLLASDTHDFAEPHCI